MKGKRIVILPAALLLGALMAVLLTVGAAADSFADVPADAYYAPAVAWALENGITTGTSFSTFSPSDTCTRGQVVTFLWRASGCPEPEEKNCPFADVAPGSYYEKAVLWAVETGITNGTSASEFSPDALCTSAHILTFLWRSLGQPDPGENGTLPLKDPGAYYAQPWIWAANNDMLRDMDGFDIESACSRAMTVTWLYRASLGWDPVVIQRQAIFDDGAICGVYYAGGLAGGTDLAGLLAGLEEDFPFLSEIPETNIVKTDGGNDVFLIIPWSEEATVSVSRWIIDGSNDYKGAEGDLLYLGNRGQPVVLCCNVSDIMPDTVVKVSSSYSSGFGGDVFFNPCISLKNGRVSPQTIFELDNDRAYEKFTDLTPYPFDETLAAPTVIRWEPDASEAPFAGGLKAVWDPVPGADEYVVKYYDFYGSTVQDENGNRVPMSGWHWRLAEHENTDETEASYFCQDYFMIRLDVRAASEKGLGLVTSIILTKEELDPILLGR